MQSGRTLAEIASADAPASETSIVGDSNPTAPRRVAKTKAESRREPITATGRFIEPMKALATTTLPRGDWWLEIKFDGYRAMAVCQGKNVRLWSRNHEPMNERFPEVVETLQRMNFLDAVIDGEIVALDKSGRSVFQLLQRRALERARVPIVYYVFDLLHLDGVSLLEQPIEKRQEALAGLMVGASSTVKRSPVFAVAPEQMLREVIRKGLEGLIAKRPASRYAPGRRSGAWLKYRVARDQEFVIGGYTPPRGARAHIGALLLGYYAGRELRYAGKVGTGFDQKTLAELHRWLKPHVRRTSAFRDLPGEDRGEARRLIGDRPEVVTWLEPRVVCQVRFNEWTAAGRLRQPVYLGLRTDKKARDVVREPVVRRSAKT